MSINRTLLILCSLFLFSENTFADCDCDYVAPSNEWLLDGEEIGIQPGDKICLSSSNTYNNMNWQNINGTEDEPVLITNCGGQVHVQSLTGSYGWKFQNSEHFKIQGDGDHRYQYGIKVSTKRGFFLAMESFTHEFEISNVEIAGFYADGTHEDSGFAGIGIKTKPYCDGSSDRGVWDMTGVSVHDNYIHGVGGEGLYIGHGFYQGRVEASCKKTTNRFTYPHAIKDLLVYNNHIENVGYDGIQVKNADENANIYNNFIRNYGTRDKGAHNEGLFVGDGSEANIFNNWVQDGTGHGMQIHAFGNTSIFNNVVINSTDDSLYLNNKSASFANKDGVLSIFNNTFVGAGDDGIEAYTPQDVMVTNNIIAAYNDQGEKVNNVTLEGNIFIDEASLATFGFVSLDNHNYHLTSQSAAVASGALVDLDFDHDDTERATLPLDVGAYAYTDLSETIQLVITTPSNNLETTSGESVYVDVDLIDINSQVERVSYVLNGKIIGKDILPRKTEHNIGGSKLILGNNIFYAEALTIDGQVVESLPITINVADTD